jgi:hypothetical protein
MAQLSFRQHAEDHEVRSMMKYYWRNLLVRGRRDSWRLAIDQEYFSNNFGYRFPQVLDFDPTF